MARARNIKPGFFRDAALVELPIEARLLFPGLWTLADRAGRLEDKPKQIKMEIYPADSFDVDDLLRHLSDAGLIVRYEIDGKRFIQVKNFEKHQNPHRDEKPSTIPEYCEHGASTVQAQCEHGGNRADSLNLIPDSLITKESASTPASTSTASGRVCARLRSAGIQGVNPSNPKLLALLSAGIPEAEFCDLAAEPKARGKGMAWILAAVEGRRKEAASLNMPTAPEKPPAVCVCCGAPASKRIGRNEYCGTHDQFSERAAA